MRRGLLIIDRGSREPEVSKELDVITKKVHTRGGYDYADFCFLEVLPPFINDAIQKCPSDNLDTLTIVPYFLYPGRKIKACVTSIMKYQQNIKTKFLVTKPMSMHPIMAKLVDRRVIDTLKKNNQDINRNKTDVLLIGHGSKDINAQLSINYIVKELQKSYRNVSRCFLEIEQPDIRAGIARCERDDPSILVIVFYFLHEGIHVKKDIKCDLLPALERSRLKNAYITNHIGTDDAMVDLILERALEVEDAD